MNFGLHWRSCAASSRRQDGLHEPTPAVLASLHEETLRLGRLVADLEAMTSADAAGFHLELRPIRLDELIRSVTEGLQDRFTGVGLTLTTTLQPVTVSADPDRVTQVLTNLLGNAVKFVPATGRVSLTLDQVEGMARLRVIDDGPGIVPEDLPHIFDRFYRGRGPRAGGSGVGLAVVDELVRAHGGQVSAAATPSGGATFTLRLPILASDPHTAFIPPSHPLPTVADMESTRTTTNREQVR